MNFLRALLLCISAACVYAPAQATYLGGSNTFVDLSWNVSGSGAQGCTQIIADATGNAALSQRIVIYGVLNCPGLGVGYAVTGTAYAGADGSFNMTLVVGGTLSIGCVRLTGASGTCSVLNQAGQHIGNIFVSLMP